MLPVGATTAIANSIMMILGMLSDHRKNALSKDYHEAIEYLNAAQNAKFPDYATSRVQIAEEKLTAFKLAFYGAVQEQIKEGKA